MSETAAAASTGASGLSATLGQLLQAGISTLASKASEMVERLTDKLEGAAEDAGPAEQAGMAAVEATAAGRSPVWAAVKGGWSGASTKVKILTILVLLLIVLLPVTLLALLLTLLILWIREAVR